MLFATEVTLNFVKDRSAQDFCFDFTLFIHNNHNQPVWNILLFKGINPFTDVFFHRGLVCINILQRRKRKAVENATLVDMCICNKEHNPIPQTKLTTFLIYIANFILLSKFHLTFAFHVKLLPKISVNKASIMLLPKILVDKASTVHFKMDKNEHMVKEIIKISNSGAWFGDLDHM